MPLNVQLVNAQVKDPDSGQMTPAGLIGSDAISTINTAKNQAVAAIEQKGEETKESIPDDYTALTDEVDELKTQLIDPNFISSAWSWNDGHYVTAATGAIGDSASYSYFSVNVQGYLAIKVTSNFGSITGICFYDSNGDFISGVNNPSGGSFSDELIVPDEAVTMKVSCVKNNKTAVTITIPPKMFNTVVGQELNKRAELPYVNELVVYTLTRGITKNDLTLYDQGEEYTGRTTHISVQPGEVYLISGISYNTNYPCAMIVNNSNVVTTILGGSSVTYSNEKIVIPDDTTTLYVNGSLNYPINIKKVVKLTQEEFDEAFQSEQSGDSAVYNSLKCQYKDGVLSIKRKHDSSHDIVLTFGNVGGNGLFNFRSAYYITNTDDVPNDDFSELSASASWAMSGSDWIGPYTVAANQNADGDAPTDEYFTGGNHRTTNTGTGGGVTAIQNSLEILVDGVNEIQTNTIYTCNSVKVKWQNTVQAYNTSKADGTGRGVLTENWEMAIDKNGIKVHNTITALENITLKKYYGLQASCAGKSYRYIGGDKRAVYIIGTNVETSGNNKCRTAQIFDSNFLLNINIFPVDLGLFESNNGSSFFATTSKLYGSLVYNHDLVITQGEKYDLEGAYIFE